MAHCISSKDNPFYDPIKAEEDAIDIITGACDAFSYEAVCQLIDQHLLADANIFSHKYDTKEGIRITQENLQFLADYHLRKGVTRTYRQRNFGKEVCFMCFITC